MALRERGFTLVELLVVIALIALVSAVASLALRDPASARLDREAERLVVLLEAARHEARAAGVAARWEPRSLTADEDFRFIGLPERLALPTRWLEPGPAAEIIGARALVLGPEPLIGPQRVVIRLDERSIAVVTDGLGPFVVEPADAPSTAR
jgi:general secretion pathway protein H